MKSYNSYNLVSITVTRVPNINIRIQISNLAAGAVANSVVCPVTMAANTDHCYYHKEQLMSHLWSDLNTPLPCSRCFCNAGGQINVGDNNLIY